MYSLFSHVLALRRYTRSVGDESANFEPGMVEELELAPTLVIFSSYKREDIGFMSTTEVPRGLLPTDLLILSDEINSSAGNPNFHTKPTRGFRAPQHDRSLMAPELEIAI
ncbi:hypothetical protein TNCV_4950711 [Trichonephila clavipes]|nr:hypothetical protein TNCV_4950711 [Trichonephila clavipes]